LADLATGHSGRIIGIDPGLDAGTAGRLHDLGFAPDADVTVLRRAPLGDPVLFAVCSYEVALRAAQARWVRVRRLP
jgi:ferrous iron transport protein A